MSTNLKYFSSWIGIFKVITVGLGALVTTLGWYVFLDSKWREISIEDGSGSSRKLYSQSKKSNFADGSNKRFETPEQSIEIASLCMISLCFLTSFFIIVYCLTLLKPESLKPGKFLIFDFICHITAAVILFVAGSILISVSVQIEDFIETAKTLETMENKDLLSRNNLHLLEIKIAVISLCYVNAIIYATTAGFIRAAFVPEKPIPFTLQGVESGPSSSNTSRGQIYDSQDQKILLNRIKLLMKKRKSLF